MLRKEGKEALVAPAEAPRRAHPPRDFLSRLEALPASTGSFSREHPHASVPFGNPPNRNLWLITHFLEARRWSPAWAGRLSACPDAQQGKESSGKKRRIQPHCKPHLVTY